MDWGWVFILVAVFCRGSRFPHTAPTCIHVAAHVQAQPYCRHMHMQSLSLTCKNCKSPHAPSPPHPLPSTTHARNTGACPSDASNCQLRFFRQRDLESLLRGASGRDSQPGTVACDGAACVEAPLPCQPCCDPIGTTICASSADHNPSGAPPRLPYSRPRVKQKQTLS